MERIGGWSARHRKTAVLGWLLLVAAVFVAGQAIGTKNLPSNDAGQSGRAEQTLQRLDFTSPPAESVLIQARKPQPASTPPTRRCGRPCARWSPRCAALPGHGRPTSGRRSAQAAPG